MIEHILVPLDTSSVADCVLPHAIALAQPFGADITLLHTVQLPPDATTTHCVDPVDWDLQKIEARRSLEALAARLHPGNVPVQSLLLEGDPEEDIVRVAQSHDSAILVLSSHAQGGIRQIGSVAQKIISRHHGSITIVRARSPVEPELQRGCYRRILVPLDGSLRAECVLPLVTRLSSFHKAHIILAHVITEPKRQFGILAPHDNVELSHRLREHRRVDALHYLVEMRARAGWNTEIRLLEGDNLAETLHKLIEAEKIDLVVMSAHGHSGNAECPYGSLVINFITHCTPSLLIVQDLPKKPEPIRVEYAPRGVLASRIEAGRHLSLVQSVR